MIYQLPYKTKQFFFVLIKISIVVITFYFIYKKLSETDELNFYEFIELSSKNSVFSVKNITILLFLSIFNWFFEILKWQKLVSEIKNISFKNATEHTLGSLTVSLFTPNRIGEYGAKAMYFTKNHRKRIMLFTLISNVLQMSITLFFGVIGFYLFITKYHIFINLSKLLMISIISVIVFALLIFFSKRCKMNIKGFSLLKIKNAIINYPRKLIGFGVFYSLLRYLIFSFQFYFLLLCFGVDILYFEAMMLISTMYLLASIIPSIAIFDVVIKGSVAMYVFSFVEINSLIIISITTLMWLFNFVFPSVIGSYFVLKFKFPKANV